MGLRWLDADEAATIGREARQRARAPLAGTLGTAETTRLSGDLLRTRVPVAIGPSTTTRLGVDEDAVWWLDLAAPRQLWLAPSSAYPPYLWIDAGSTADGLRAAASEFFPTPRRTRRQHVRRVRAFLFHRFGFALPDPVTSRSEDAWVSELCRFFDRSPFLEAGRWGGHFLDDPWPQVFPPQPRYARAFSTFEDDVAEQRRDRVWSVSWRSRHSRSFLKLEFHHGRIVVLDLSYTPSAHPQVLDRLHSYFSPTLPEDVPIDLVAALIGFPLDRREVVEGGLDLARDANEKAGLIYILASLLSDDPQRRLLCSRYIDDDDGAVRSAVANVAIAHGHRAILEELWLREPVPLLREQMATALEEEMGPRPWDPWHEYDADDAELLDA
jgi:hypothetical protein